MLGVGPCCYHPLETSRFGEYQRPTRHNPPQSTYPLDVETEMAHELPQAQTPCRCRLILPITACAVSETSILSTRMTCVPPCRRRRIVSTWAANAFSSRAPADAIMATCRSPP